MRKETFGRLLQQRWNEAATTVGLVPGSVGLSWALGDNYPHFNTKRGYGVTFNAGEPRCHLLFASKILKAPVHRADGIIRHEIGHVLDFVVDDASLNGWAVSRGKALASTPERRADDIAEVVWGTPILYERPHLIQSTKNGVAPRPLELGP